MQLIHISDTHIAHDKPNRAADLEACVAHINALPALPDAVIHTGDIAHSGRPDEYQTARHVLDQLAVPCFVVPGNRDDRQNLARAFDGMGPIQADMGFIQYAVEDFPVRLIAVDTVDHHNNKGRLCADRLAQVRDLLDAGDDRSACVFLHHPPFRVDVGPDRHHFGDVPEADALVAELRRHPSVRTILCGHVHRAFRTTVGTAAGNVVSCLANDLRWDKPEAAERGLPVYDSYTLLSAPMAAG